MDTAQLNSLLRQKLEADLRSGLTHIPRAAKKVELQVESGTDDTVPPSAAVESNIPQSVEVQKTVAPTPQQEMRSEPVSPVIQPTTPTTLNLPGDEDLARMSSKERQKQLNIVAEEVSRCTRCKELAETRSQTVFGVGDPNAGILFIGEAPGADEDAQGEPFVGRAGKLLTKIIEACHLRREDIYICNILKCRPPGNRNPSDAEACNCREYLDAQIKLVDPDYIVCWGSVAAKNLLQTQQPIGKMRQTFFSYGRAKVACTYHPSYLLRNPPAKKDVWEDMKWLFSDMKIDL
ncbi:uracil-DNA glycosylase [Calycomorphotria hydatis]|nr:uracil-DNA glycosylase [Calycomorphotria hydatis]